MSAANSYPEIAATAATRLLGVEDPTDPGWTVDLYDPADFGGGVTWTQAINETGASTTNFTAYNGGTWSSDGTIVTCLSGGSGSYFWHSTAVPTGMLIVQADLLLPSSNASSCYAGIALMQSTGSSSPTHGDAPYVRIQRSGGLGGAIDLLGGRPASDRVSIAVPGGAIDTWYTVRMVLIGGVVTAYIDGVQLLPSFGNTEYRANVAALWNYSSNGSYRNFKVWTADLGLPG